MQSKQYHDAIELYNCAIALHEENAIYYCNRFSVCLYWVSIIVILFPVDVKCMNATLIWNATQKMSQLFIYIFIMCYFLSLLDTINNSD